MKKLFENIEFVGLENIKNSANKNLIVKCVCIDKTKVVVYIL